MRNALKVLIAIGVIAAPSVHAQSTTTYTYDNLGRLKSVSSSPAYTTSYSYDAADNRTNMQTALGANHAPVCTNWTIDLSSVPPYAGIITVSPDASSFIGHCTDADNDTMTVASPAMPFSFQISSGQTLTFNFSVTDGRGGTGSAVLTATRP